MGNNVSPLTVAQTNQYKANYQKLCSQAADIINDADIFLLTTGAGFSADSGLAVYKDIAKVAAYEKMKVDYHDLCQPKWITEDPEIFYGFWGMCYNDYRRVVPHEGYSIIKKWKEMKFSKNKATDLITQYQKERIQRGLTAAKEREDADRKEGPLIEVSNVPVLEKLMNQLSVEEKVAGPFFIFTSNVDTHSLTSGFQSHEIYEIHGNTELWQCSIPCCESLWNAPKQFSFQIDMATMRAADGPVSNADKLSENWKGNHPTCIHCGAKARPSILMFEDSEWIEDRMPHKNYENWKTAVYDLLREHPEWKMAILEIGCGQTIPTVRYQSQSFLKSLNNCTLIRVNPDFPQVPDNINQSVSIMGNGLETIKNIDKYLNEKRSASTSNENVQPSKESKI